MRDLLLINQGTPLEKGRCLFLMEKEKNNNWNAYTRTYRINHPEKVRQWRLNAIANELRKAGYVVIPPKETLEGQEDQK